jgi:predicted permease
LRENDQQAHDRELGPVCQLASFSRRACSGREDATTCAAPDSSNADVRNLKLAFRALFKSPLLTSVAILSLALGIGANVAVFSLFDQLMLRPLPVSDPGRLVNLSAPGPKPGGTSCNQAGDCEEVFSYPMFGDLQRVQTVFTGIAAHRLFDANLSYHGETLNGEGMLVSGGYFPVLGLRPALGRLIGPDDDSKPGASPVVVLSHAHWRTRFAADPSVVGRTMIVNGQVMTVVGVAPRGFQGTTLGSEPKIFVPLTMRALMQPGWNQFEDRRSYSFYLFARLRPATTIDAARAAINAQYHAIINEVEASLQQGVSDQTLARFRAKPILVSAGRRGQSGIPNRSGPALALLLGVTALVLLIACANIANLLLARSAAREGEMAVRLSLGASRRHLLGQLLTESAVLAAGGGLVGVLVAQWTLHLIWSLLPSFATESFQFALDRGALVFAAALAMGTGLLFGLFPALHSTRPDLASALKGQAGQPSGARAAARFRISVATAQIALSTALLIAAGLFTKSLFNVSQVDLGLKPDKVITFDVSPSLNGYAKDRSLQLFTRLENDLAGLPGVTGVSDSLVALLRGNNWGNDVSVQGYRTDPDTDMGARYNEIGTDYFSTLGIPVLSGREFTRADEQGNPKVAIVNEAFVKKFRLGGGAVGMHVGARSGPLDTEIVGVARNAKYSEVKGEIPPLLFRPYRQGNTAELGFITFYVRTAADDQRLLADVRKTVARADANLPINNLRTINEQARDNVFLDRFISVMSVAFAGLATLLAAIGLYGVLAYTLAQRTREIGLRMALGAAPAQVRMMVLRQVGKMAVVGGAVGVFAALGLGRLAQSMLYQLQGSDPAVVVASLVTLALVVLGAGCIPAERASRVDPMRALRYE